MAVGNLTDIVKPETFAAAIESKVTENSRIRQAGLVKSDPRFAINKGFETTVPFWRHPAGGEAQSQNDSSAAADRGTTNKLTQGKMTARVLSRANAFSHMAIADYASATDAIAYAKKEFGRLRISDEESAMLAILAGIEAANTANLVSNDANGDPLGIANDMIVDVAATTGSLVDLDKDVFLEGRKSMGDRGSDLKIVIAHSDVVNGLRAKEPTAFQQMSGVNMDLTSYWNWIVVESDNAPVDRTDPLFPIYTSYIAGPELFAYATGLQDNPIEDVRDAAAGGWSAQNSVVNRFRYMLHPYGFQNSGNPANGVSLLNGELSDGTNWTRCVERKAVPLTILKTNG